MAVTRLYLLLCLTAFSTVAFAFETVNFKSDLCAHKAVVEPEVKKFVADHQFFFLHGYLNGLYGRDAISTYGLYNRIFLNGLGAQVTVRGVFSKSSIIDNGIFYCDLIGQQLSQAKAAGKKLIVIGHSMGGGTIAALVARCPQILADDTLDSLVSVQGVFNGTPVADAHSDARVAQEWSAFTGQAQSVNQSVLRSLSGDLLNIVGDLTEDGINALSSAGQKPLLSEIEGLSKERLAIAKRKVSFVTAEISPENASFVLRPLCEFIAASHVIPGNNGANDCLVPVSSQFNELIGERLLHVEEASHVDMWFEDFVSGRFIGQKQCVESFMTKLMSMLVKKQMQ
jgi:hypothetical protein